MVFKVPGPSGLGSSDSWLSFHSLSFLSALLAHALLFVLKPQPYNAAFLSHGLPQCTPFSQSNYNGTWSYTDTDPPKLKWTLGSPCKQRVSTADEFFVLFDKRTLAFAGDSQVRELTWHSMGYILGCCWMQGLSSEEDCDLSKVADEGACGEISKFEPYPPVPQIIHLARGGRRVTVIYAWLAYPREALVEGKDTFLSLFLAGTDERYAGIDALLLGWGHWDLVFTQPKRSDNQRGLEECLGYTAKVGEAMARALEERPELGAGRVVWKQMTPDEIDCTPHPQFRKRMILPDFRRQAREGLGRIWGKGGVGLAVWDPYTMLDVRAGGMERPMNENVLTVDGMHFLAEINEVLIWDLLSWWADKVGGVGGR